MVIQRGLMLLVMVLCLASPAVAATLSWNANTEADLDGYRVYRKASASSDYGAALATLPKTQTNFVTPDPDPGQTYFYTVTAHDLAGNESPKSNEVSKTVASLPPPVTGPNCVATATESGHTWCLVGSPPLYELWLDGSRAVQPNGQPDWTSDMLQCHGSGTVYFGGTHGDTQWWWFDWPANVWRAVPSKPTCTMPPPPPPVDTTPPTAPAGLKVVSATADQIVISALKTDCPNGIVTTTAGTNATSWQRVVTCRR